MAVEEPSIICDRAISGADLPLSPHNVAPGCGHAATHRTCDRRSPPLGRLPWRESPAARVVLTACQAPSP